MAKVVKIPIDDQRYPKMLRQIDDPPKVLYCIGDISLLNTHCIASVGARRCSEYGKKVAMKIGEKAALSSTTLVSGMASGIDSYSHIGCLKLGGKTIAVLGGGPDVCYPKSNKHLYEQIGKSGLIISENPGGQMPRQFDFPRRNRIIAGISESVVIVEAATKSGSLITAECAIAQGKRVMAIPGNITSPGSLGANKLIADGAECIAVIDDIFGSERRNNVAVIEELGDDERKVYEIIASCSELSCDDLIIRTKMSAGKVMGIVSILEMKGLIAYDLGKIFVVSL